jgi:hypothetical protein
MGTSRLIRVGLAGITTALLAVQLLVAPPAVSTVTATSKTIQGAATNNYEKDWFNKEFDTGPDRFFGKVRGRMRFVTDTRATLSTTRTIGVTDRGELDAGEPIGVFLSNQAQAARLQVTARPAFQMIFEWQPKGDPYVCNNTTFPVFPDGEWHMRTDGGGPILDGMCGAFEVTADDLNWIFETSGIDLELPEVFSLIDKFFTPGYTGTQNISESHQIFEIKVCNIIYKTFGIIGDHCDLEFNAVATAPLTTLGHTVEAQVCTDETVNGVNFNCAVNVGPKQDLTFPGGNRTFSVEGPCPSGPRRIDVRLSNPAWEARVESVTIAPTLDFNVHLTADGDGVDLITIPLPGQISLLDAPLPLNLSYAGSGSNFLLHVATMNADDDAPTAYLNPSAVTTNEGSSTTFQPFLADLCTATGNLRAAWSIDGLRTFFGPTLTRSYDNDLPNAVHNGTLLVNDEAGNQAPEVPFSVTVRNVPPSVQLSGLPANPVPRGTTLKLGSQVGDPGADIESWNWSFGDGTSESRTATSVSDRADSRSHTYALEGLYTMQLGVHDGTDLQSAGGAVTVFDPLDRLVGSGTFKADTSSVNVPVGSSYSAQATVAYANGAVRPSGSFVSDFLINIGSGETVSKHLAATSYEWIFESGLVSKTQGLATLSGESGWKFQAEVTRSKVGAQTARITVTVWRPGVTTFANPDYRFGGPRSTGNIQ